MVAATDTAKKPQVFTQSNSVVYATLEELTMTIMGSWELRIIYALFLFLISNPGLVIRDSGKKKLSSKEKRCTAQTDPLTKLKLLEEPL